MAVITAYGNVETAVRALKLGAFDFVSKPVDLGVLRKLVDRAHCARSVAGRGATGTRTGTQLLGDSPAMEQLRAMIAQGRAQPGAGAHLRRIGHRQGTGRAADPRDAARAREGPFVPVNCGAIPTELMESEFFGHKKGSFTGAVADKAGLFQSAEGGTLFLDEVAELPLHMQVKLLRVIQEKTVRPVGEATRGAGRRAHPVARRTRISASWSRKASFRQDLFYRINVIELRVPPLRERARRRADAGRVIAAPARARQNGDRRRNSTPEALQPRCATIDFPATCASWKTSSSARSRCAGRARSTSTTCSCAADGASTARRRRRHDGSGRGDAAGRRSSRTSSATRS